MGVGDSIKDFYYSLEDKWYGFVDKVSDKLPFFGKSIDWVEEKGIPSFPLAIILVILIILVLFSLFFASSVAPLTVNVVDNSGASLSGAIVTVFAGENPISLLETNEEGKAIFSLANGMYTVKVEKEGYGTLTNEMGTNSEETFTLALIDGGSTKAVYMKTASGQIITGAGTVTYYCKGDPDNIKTAFYQDGKFNADFSSTCIEIVIASVSGYKVVSGTALFSGGSVTLEKEETNTGTVRVNLSATETIPPGIRVVLTSEDGVPQQTLVSETGVVVFQTVPTKKYYVTVYDGRVDPAIKYSPYDGKSLGELKEVVKNQTTEFNISLEKIVSAKITVTVRNVETSAPLSGAEVSLTLVGNENKLERKVTGATGQIVFDVAENENYTLTAEHPEYLIGTTNSQITVPSSQQSVELFLIKATAENSQSLNVKVLDKENAPIDSVKVVLKKLDETIIAEKTTGAEGTVDFYNLDIGQYYVYAAKESYASANSASIQVLPRKQANLEIKLDIGKGTIKVRVLDPENSPLKGANVKLINYYTQKQEEQKTTDTQGYAEFSVREDKLIYFIVEASNVLKYHTATIIPDEGSTIERDIVMIKPTGQLTTTILPLQTGNATLAQDASDRTVNAGVYTVRAVVAVPKGTFSEAGIHLRTGKATEGTTNTMEEDNAVLGTVMSSATKTIRGTTFTPPNGYDKDQKALTTGNSKWVNFSWRNPSEGAYEAEAELSISEINPNQGVNLWYRGWAKGSSMLRDPASATQSNELYSNAKNYIMSGGATNLCVNGVCKAYTLQILSGSEAGRKLYIGNSFTGKKGIQYLLTADITNNTGKIITGATLVLETIGLDANAVIINGVEYLGKEINVGTIGIDGYLQVKVLFTIASAGTDSLKLKINSAVQTLFEDTITATVATNKKFTLDIIPKEIVPYITNSMFFETKDGNNAVQGVLIEIKKGTNVLGTKETSSEGLAVYELSAPTVGDVITIKATKEGYDSIEIEKIVDKSILIVTPPEISEIIKIGEVKSIEQTVVLENASPATVKIKSVDFTGELKSYLDMKFSNNLIESSIPVGTDKNYSLTIKPNATGSKLREPKDVKGEITIAVEIAGTKQLFETIIPVTIRLSMPGYIDSTKCLKVTPATIELIAGGTETTQTIEIENSCTAEGIQVNLHNIQAKLNEANKLGSISINGTGFSGTLSETYTKIGEILAKDTKESLTVRFVPNGSISSGTQNLTITISGENIPEENEKETVEASLKAKLTMSNLSKCVTIEKPAGGIVLDVAGWNMGYNRLMGSNLNSQLGAYASQYQGFSNRGTMPYGMRQNLPFMSGQMGQGGQYGQGQQQASNSSYEQSSFTIKNSCAVDVEIDLDPDSRLNVSEEKFTIGKDSDNTITVTPGYTLGKYKIVVNAKPANTEETKKNIDSVSVLVRKLGDIDRDCIKVNTTKISLNSFIYQPKKYKVYNYCYDSGVQLPRGNNAVTIQCDAPNMIMNPAMMNQMTSVNSPQPYLQMGMEGLYGNSYPTNSSYNTLYDYVMPQGCGGNQCVMVTGTRVFQQNLLEGSNGTTEEITFEVMPNSSYMPQRRLFNNNTGQYGLFQSLGDIRAWLTETDARTNIYGNINVQYNNQYGQTQCMSFPVEIEDDWRMLESIDSAINWGDPNAKPSECVDEKRPLDIYEYWRLRGNGKGNVPDNEYKNNGSYLHIANPPAVRIGPAPNSQFGANAANMFYPGNQYQNMFSQNQQTNKEKEENSGASKNCGLLDKISKLEYTKEIGGVVIVVEGTTQGGSIINNTKGPNLMVSLNRSGIKANCVFIDTTVRGKLTRSINFYSEEVTWKLKALVTRPGYIVQATTEADLQQECITSVDIDQKQCEEYLKQIISTNPKGEKETDAQYGKRIYDILKQTYPQCSRYYSENNVLGSIAVAKEGCTTDATKYGFSLIKETITEEAAKNINNFCNEAFCNTTMLDLFLKNKVKSIKSAATGISTCTKSNGMLSQLYKEAETTEMTQCSGAKTNFYKGDTGLIEANYTIPGMDKEPGKTNTAKVKEGTDNDTIEPINNMLTLIQNIPTKDQNKVLVKFGALNIAEESLNKVKTGIGLVEVSVGSSKTQYMPLSYYIELNSKIRENYSNCNEPNTACEITVCGQNISITPEAMKSLAEGLPSLVMGTSVEEADKNVLEAEKVIAQNAKFAEIKKYAIFDSNSSVAGASKEIYLTQITQGKKPTDTAINNASLSEYKDYSINYYIGNDKKDTLTIGKYTGELDLNLCTNAEKTIKLTVKETELKEAPEAKKNILLQKEFEIETDADSITDSSRGAIVGTYDGKTKLFSRTPVKLTVDLYGGENALNYTINKTIASTANLSLIKWYDGTTAGNDKKVSTGFVYALPASTSAKTIKGIYYYTNNGAIIFQANMFGGKVTAQVASGEGTINPITVMIPTNKTQSTQAMELTGGNEINLNDVTKKVIEGKACIAVDGQSVIWNETQLLK